MLRGEMFHNLAPPALASTRMRLGYWGGFPSQISNFAILISALIFWFVLHYQKSLQMLLGCTLIMTLASLHHLIRTD